MRRTPFLALLFATSIAGAQSPFSFSTGNVDGRAGFGSRPASAGKIEIEAADDFILPSETVLTGGSFTGLLVPGTSLGDIGSVRVEIYRVFPKDSQDPPSGRVPTRVNSPSDVAFDTRSSGTDLAFTTAPLAPSFSVGNSILNGIHPLPNVFTGGEGQLTGEEVLFSVSFTTPFDLPAGHYFFVPQVELSTGEFFWLSSVRPIVPPGTPFSPDLQLWIRDQNLDPDWLRAGTDIIGGTTFNAAFTLNGTAVPEPSSLALLSTGAGALGGLTWRRRRRG